MTTFALHFKSVLYQNYNPFREPLQVKFVNCGADRVVQQFSIQYTDGFTKGLICQSIVALIDTLDPCL